MNKKKSVKRVIGMTVALILGSMVFSGCGGGNQSDSQSSKKPYDPASRVPTDSGEQIVTFNESDYERYNNYIELYDGDGDMYDIGDPYVFRFDGKYYLYTSLNGNKKTSGKIPCWESDNMVDWKWSGWAYDPKSSEITSETYIAFAPEVVYYKGWFYMCESRRGQGHYFFRSNKPNGPFTLISGNLGMGIDGSFYLHDDGSLYFVSANDSLGCLTYYTIDFPENSSGVPSVVLGKANKITEAYLNGWTEGPGYFKRNGYTYLTYTGNHVDSAGYKVAYSVSKDNFPFTGLTSKWYNTTLISTGLDNEAPLGYGAKNTIKQVSNYRGLGHSSNVIGPDLDGIYTAYHNANRINYDNTMVASTRKYNVTRYFTNGSYVLTDGLGNYSKVKPTAATYSARADLVQNGGYCLSAESTEKVFTAEVNFTLGAGKGNAVFGFADAKNYSGVSVDNGKLEYFTVKNGTKKSGGTVNVPVSTNANAVHTVKLVNGSDKAEVYYDNVRVINSNEVSSAGKIGVSSDTAYTSVYFSNNAFGTSDFEAVKDLTGSFAATSYLKGENRGYSIANARTVNDGVRQGEKEYTVYSEENDARALVLEAGDWVKYLVDAPYDDDYSLSLTVGKQSKGCVFEIIVDNETIIKAEIPDDTEFGDKDYANVNVGSFHCGKGLHTLKIRVFDGTLDALNFYTSKNGGELGQVTDNFQSKTTSVFTQKVGTKASFSQAGLMTNSSDERTLLLTGNRGTANYEFSVNVKILSQAGNGGILFRMNNFSHTDYKTTSLGTNFDGYYLSLGKYLVTLQKRSYGRENISLGGTKPAAELSLANGNQVRVTVSCKNSKISIYLNGELFIDVVDTECFTSGYIAFYAEKESGFLFSDYEYYEI